MKQAAMKASIAAIEMETIDNALQMIAARARKPAIVCICGSLYLAGRVLSDLKALGIRLSIDDFGVGYSSLSRLRRFPVDTLKIDRVFVSAMEDDRESREIVRAIITLAQTLGLKVVAEGTETQSQIDQLRDLGCDMAQGYFFSRPCDVASASKLLSATIHNQAPATC